MKYKPVMCLEEELINDGLEVTQAIIDLEKSKTSSPEQVEIKINSQNKEKDVDQSDAPFLDEKVDELEIKDESAEELEEATNDASALECIACDIEKQKELTPEQQSVINALLEKYKVQNTIANEDFAGVANAVKDALSKIWKFILDLVSRIASTIKENIQIQKSKLNIAADDIDNIFKNLESITDKGQVSKEIPISGYKSLVVGSDTSNKSLIKNALIVEKVIIGYFDHVRSNFPGYLKSVTSLYSQDIRELSNLTNEEDADGVLVLNTGGTIRLTKDTLPGFMRYVPFIKDYKPPFNGALTYSSEVIPGNVRIVGWVAKESEVNTGSFTNVLESKIILIGDKDARDALGGETLSVMNLNDLKLFLSNLQKVLTAMEAAEAVAMSFITQFGEITKLVDKLKKEAEVFEKKPAVANMRHVAAYKRRAANLMNSLVVLTKKFYADPNQTMMLYGNMYLAAGIRYANTCTNIYTDKAKTT